MSEENGPVAEHGAAAGHHPIECLMKTAMESLESIVDVNTVVGDPIETRDGSIVVPVSQVSLGFAAGGAEVVSRSGRNEPERPFGGGSGAGVSVRPVAFLVVQAGTVRLLPVSDRGPWDRVVDMLPELMERVERALPRLTGLSAPSNPPDGGAGLPTDGQPSTAG